MINEIRVEKQVESGDGLTLETVSKHHRTLKFMNDALIATRGREQSGGYLVAEVATEQLKASLLREKELKELLKEVLGHLTIIADTRYEEDLCVQIKAAVTGE